MSDPQTPARWGMQLSKLWIQSGMPFPVDVRELAPVVSKQRFADPIGLIRPHGIAGIDGMLSRRKSKGDWCISYDEQVTSRGRINFTLAHEFGHYLLHRSLRDGFSCAPSALLAMADIEEQRIEREANVFASYLLMPASDFRAFVGAEPIDLERLRACAARYGTSLTAAALKYVELTDEAVVLVLAREDFIVWSVPSRRARLARAYFPPGTPLPAGVGVGAPDGRRVALGVWHAAHEAQEFAITSDRYDMAVFLVRLLNARQVVHEEEEIPDSYTQMMERSGRLCE